MIQNVKLCECCRRIMPAFSIGLFCEDCKNDFKELEEKFEDNRNKIILFIAKGV